MYEMCHESYQNWWEPTLLPPTTSICLIFDLQKKQSLKVGTRAAADYVRQLKIIRDKS